MKILFFGDSIMGMNRNPDNIRKVYHLGSGYVFEVAAKLAERNPAEYEIVNRGNGGNTVLDLYARIKGDVWEERPDVITFHVGTNDLYHKAAPGYEVDEKRFESAYSMMIEETMKKLPSARIILDEPFISYGKTTVGRENEYKKIKDYAAIVKKIAEKYGAEFLPLADTVEKMSLKYGYEAVTFDGVHPTLACAAAIADEWIKLFDGKKE